MKLTFLGTRGEIEARTDRHRRHTFTVEHSIRAPAVGYRIAAGRVTVFYAPDLVYIHEREDALRGCDLYVGDGATLDRRAGGRSGDRP